MPKLRAEAPVVEVQWVDATSHTGWKSRAVEKLAPVECLTVGYKLHEDKMYMRIAQSLANNGDYADVIVIPRQWVRRVRRLRGAK